MDRPGGRRVLRFDGAFGPEGCCGGFAADDKVSVTGLTFSVIWHDKHSGDWLTAFASPFPAARDFPRKREQNKTPLDNLLINPPLEMTVTASAPLVISTVAERSGEISSL